VDEHQRVRNTTQDQPLLPELQPLPGAPACSRERSKAKFASGHFGIFGVSGGSGASRSAERRCRCLRMDQGRPEQAIAHFKSAYILFEEITMHSDADYCRKTIERLESTVLPAAK